MKKICILIFFILINLMPVSAQTTITISNESDLIAFSESVNSGNSYQGQTVVLGTDVVLSSAWIPVGNENAPFSGTFDGNGHKISGVTFEPMTVNAGLFGVSANTANILSLTVELDVTVSNSKTGNFIGGIVSQNHGTVSGCKVSGSILAQNSASRAYAGGVAAYNDGVITECVSDADVKSAVTANWEITYADALAGGICGKNDGEISECSVTELSEVNAKANYASASAGGICGDNRNIIESCESYAAVAVAPSYSYSKVKYFYCGGIAGCNTGKISDSTVQGTIGNSGSIGYCGGVVGYNDKIIENSVAKAIVTGLYAGGFVGLNGGEITSCSAESTVYSTKYLGGFAGYSENGKITLCTSNSESEIMSGEDASFVGGFVGEMTRTSVSMCSAYGTFSGVNTSVSGGFVGNAVSGEIYDSFAIANAFGRVCGGFAAQNNLRIKNCYSVGDADVFCADEKGNTTDCWHNTPNYTGWNFDSLWKLDENKNYGYAYFSENGYTGMYSGGDGTAANPYIIKTQTDLINIRYMPASHFSVKRDISLQHDWVPIGSENAPFEGVINGNKHVISNLNTGENENEKYAGFIGFSKNAKITEIDIDGKIAASDISDYGIAYAGGIVSYAENCEITDCSFSGEVDSRAYASYAGGIAGYISGKADKCVSDASVTSDGFAGELFGGSDAEITNCVFDGNVNGKVNGGIVGTQVGSITNCGFKGSITDGEKAGGIAGRIYGDIQNCYALGSGNLCGEHTYGTDVNSISTTETENLKSLLGGTWNFNGNAPIIGEVRVKTDALSSSVTLETDACEIVYTTDGTDPKTYGEIYTLPIIFGRSATIKVALKDSDGNVIETYTFTRESDDKSPVVLCDSIRNSTGEKITKSNVKNAGSLNIKLDSAISSNAVIYVACYGETGNLNSASVARKSMNNGVQTIGVNLPEIPEIFSKLVVYIWTDTAMPCSIPYVIE